MVVVVGGGWARREADSAWGWRGRAEQGFGSDVVVGRLEEKWVERVGGGANVQGRGAAGVWLPPGLWGNVGEGVRHSSHPREGGRAARTREPMPGWSVLVECHSWEPRLITGQGDCVGECEGPGFLTHGERMRLQTAWLWASA